MDPRMKEFHHLVEQERYREARGILETENLDPEIVAKWTKWLDELHRTERVLVGVSSDKRHPQEKQQAYAELGQVIGSAAVIIMAATALWLAIGWVFTTPNMAVGGFFLVIAIVAGFSGWKSILQSFTSTHQQEIAGIITLVLVLYLFTSGIPLMYYYEPPMTYVVPAFILIMPFVAQLGWVGGGWLGKIMGNGIWKLTHESPKDKS